MDAMPFKKGGDFLKCTLRQWRLSDAADLAAAINNPNVQKNLRDGLPYPYTEKDAEEFIQYLLHANPDSIFAFAITVDDRAIGSISVERGTNIHRYTGELGYYIAENYWGKGLASSAVEQIVQYIFTHTDIMRIFAEPFSYNIASCRVLEKNGFQYEGTLRRNAVKNGAVLDMKLYARLR